MDRKVGIIIGHKIKLIQILFICLAYISCSSEDIITRESAMASFKELSPKEGAIFYINNHKEYSFLDSIYRDSIMPAVLQCNYFDSQSSSRLLHISCLPHSSPLLHRLYTGRLFVLHNRFYYPTSRLAVQYH